MPQEQPVIAEVFAVTQLQLNEVEAAVALWEEAGLIRPWDDAPADARRALNSPASTVLAGRLNGRLVATTMIGFDGHRGWIYYLAVANDCRRQGFGKTMMEHSERWLSVRGAPRVNLMVRGDNLAVIGFYRALDYTQGDVIVLSRQMIDV
jgi:ribosomal protein S18 acetylase RimI-like enzyme